MPESTYSLWMSLKTIKQHINHVENLKGNLKKILDDYRLFNRYYAVQPGPVKKLIVAKSSNQNQRCAATEMLESGEEKKAC